MYNLYIFVCFKHLLGIEYLKFTCELRGIEKGVEGGGGGVETQTLSPCELPS